MTTQQIQNRLEEAQEVYCMASNKGISMNDARMLALLKLINVLESTLAERGVFL